MDRTQAWLIARLSLSMPSGSLWASVVRVRVRYKPELPWEMCWGPPPGQRLPSHTAQPFSHALQLHLLAAHACGQPDIHFSCSTAGEPDLEGEDIRPRPHRLGPSFTTAGRWRAAAGDSGSWVPHAFGPEGCQAGTLCPSALYVACLRLPRAGLSQPCLENAFYLREALLSHQEFMSLVYGSGPESLGHSFGMCQQKYPLRSNLDSDFSFSESQD